MPDEVPVLAQRHPAWCHRLNLKVRSTLCQKRTPSSASETVSGIGAVTRPVDQWARVVEHGLRQMNTGSGGKTGGRDIRVVKAGTQDGGAEDWSRELEALVVEQ